MNVVNQLTNQSTSALQYYSNHSL